MEFSVVVGFFTISFKEYSVFKKATLYLKINVSVCFISNYQLDTVETICFNKRKEKKTFIIFGKRR